MNNFEDRLLSALKEEITTRKAENTMTTTVTPARDGSRRRIAGLSAALAGVAAAATAVVTLTGVGGAPAYAVTKGGDGAVTVRVDSFSDPEGLESALRDAGVPAVVDYLPAGRTCRQPRGERGGGPGEFAVRGGAGKGIEFTIAKGRVAAGETLVLVVSKSADGDDAPPFGTDLSVVKGAVSACVPVSMPGVPEKDGGRDGGPGFDTGTEDGQGPHLDSKTG